MSTNTPEFIKCAMDAIEEGVRPEEIKEECACRTGLQSHEFGEENINQS